MKRKGFFFGIISLIAIIGIWALMSFLMGSPFILPQPASVFLDLFRLFVSADFIKILGATCYRGMAAFGISLLISIILGVPAGMYKGFSAALKPWMTIIKATPVVSIILIALLSFGSNTVPVFVSVLMTLPIMTESIAKGVQSSDVRLLEMSEIYRMRTRDILLNIRIPSALPYFFAGAGSSLGLTWKVVVAGEILGSPRWGLGSAMQTAKIHLETTRVFSLTITAILLCVITDLLFDRIVIRFAKMTKTVTVT